MAATFTIPTVQRGEAFSLEIIIENPDVWDGWMNCTNTFMKYWEDYFKEIVFECHRYLIRLTPISTGRLRGGWTGILAKYNEDFQAAMDDTSLVTLRDYKPSMDFILEGMSMSQFVDDPLLISVINSVPYGEWVEWGTSQGGGQYFTNRALFKAEFIFQHAVDAWCKVMSDAGEIVAPPPVEATVS